MLGEYVVLDQIGAGGMGQVFKARHRTMDRLVALKTLPRKAMKDPEAVKRFHREVRAAAKLEHPNIVIAFDAGEADGIHFLVMQYVDGQDLGAIVAKRGRLSVEQAIECIVQTARGLEYAHSEGVVHRDIKPSNLLLDRKGTVKILDLGLARIFEGHQTAASDRLTDSGQVMGTCDYMAPEQAEDAHHADGRSDIYSLGCTLFRLLTGRKPFEGDTLIQILFAHQQAPIPSLRDGRPDVAAELDEVFHRMVAKHPSDRYQSMTEVIAALQACVVAKEPQPVAAEPSGDSALTSFLQHLAEEAAPSRQEAPIAEETLKPAAEDETSRQFWRRLVSADRSKIPVHVGIAAGIAFVLLLLFGVVLRVKTPEGILEIKVSDGEDVEVVVSQDGKQVEIIDTRTRTTLKLRPGAYELHLVKGGNDLRITPENVTLRRGRKAIVEVSREGPPAPPLAIAPFDGAQASKHQEAWADYLAVPVEITNSIGMKLVLVPPGEFLMGSPESDPDAQDNEKPQRKVSITQPLYFGKYEVTQAEYEQVMGRNPARYVGDPRRPVERVTWYDAVEFCNILSEMEGLNPYYRISNPERDDWGIKSATVTVVGGSAYRLPTQAEWEYACRAGSTTKYYFDDSESELGRHAWYSENSADSTHPVGEKEPNAFGLFDIQGNVREWCVEKWPSSADGHHNRGTSWWTGAKEARSANRHGSRSYVHYNNIGFRVARTP